MFKNWKGIGTYLILACMWGSKDNFMESFLSSHVCMGFGSEIRYPGFLSKHLYPLNVLNGVHFLALKNDTLFSIKGFSHSVFC